MTSLFETGWKGNILAVIAGTLITLSLAPFNIWPLGIVSAALLYLLIQTLSPKQAFIRGWFFGAGLLGTGASWVYVSIHVYGYAPVPAGQLFNRHLLWRHRNTHCSKLLLL